MMRLLGNEPYFPRDMVLKGSCQSIEHVSLFCSQADLGMSDAHIGNNLDDANALVGQLDGHPLVRPNYGMHHAVQGGSDCSQR